MKLCINVHIIHAVMISLVHAGGEMGSASQSAVLPSLPATPTLVTSCVLSWPRTTTAVVRATTATGGVEAKILEATAHN